MGGLYRDRYVTERRWVSGFVISLNVYFSLDYWGVGGRRGVYLVAGTLQLVR